MNPLHYPSIELCKKLQEVGFPETEKYMEALPNGTVNSIFNTYSTKLETDEDFPQYFCPNVMEMLDVMPNYITNPKWECGYNLEIFRQVFDFHGYFVNYVNGNQIKEVTIGPLPNSLVEMVLWLVEHKHLSFYK